MEGEGGEGSSPLMLKTATVLQLMDQSVNNALKFYYAVC
jgi:hypothetical protein